MKTELTPVEKFEQLDLGRVLICIDVANLETSVRQMHVSQKEGLANYPEFKGYTIPERQNLKWVLDYKLFKNYFLKFNLIDLNFYVPAFSTDEHKKFLFFLKKELGFKLITKSLKEMKDLETGKTIKKANFDVELSVDAALQMNDFDTLILFSGDSDFAYLIQKLRSHGKKVVGFSRDKNVSTEVRQMCNHYFDIANFRNVFMKIKKRNTPISGGSRLKAIK